MAVKKVKYTKHKIRWKMGKNLLRKIFAFIVMVVGAVTIFSACSKDPYKKMRLALDKTEVTIVYDDDDNDKNVFSISATVSGVGKKVSKDVTFVVGDNSVVSPIGSDYVSTSGDKTTATFVATSNGGRTYIDVLTLEGNKRQRVDVNVVVPIEDMSFEMATLPIERGVKTDITSKFDGVSTQIYDRLTFTPQNTTQRDVILIATDDSGNAFTGNEVTIDGNYITVNSETLNSFKLTATSKDNSEITASITCTVLDTIDTDNISLFQVMGDDDPIALEYTFEQGQKVYLLDLASTSSNSENDKRKEIYIGFNTDKQFDEYTVGLVTLDTLPYSIVDDKQGHFAVFGGVYDSTGLSYFALRYKGYENLFAPKYITLRVNVSTFPDNISFTDGVETIDSVKVYQNYHSSVGGTTVKLNIFNGNTMLNTQTAYLSVEADGYGVISGVKLWYYSGGNRYDITPNTRVKHGETIYMSHNMSEVQANTIKLVGTSTVCDLTGSVVLDIVTGSVAPAFANGSVIKLEESSDANNPNTFLLSTTELEDLPYLSLGSNKISLSDCVVRLQNNSVVTCVYDNTQNGFVFTAGELPEGTTDLSISGSITTPNGMIAYFEVLVYANVNSDTLALRIGNKNYVFSDSDISLESYPLTMQTGSNIEMKLVKLLDFKMDAFGDLTDEYDPEGRYEVFSVLPSNMKFEDISYDGNTVVSVDASNKFLIRSASNSTGTRKVSYTLSSTSYDPSVSDAKTYIYIAFSITVKSRLNGFSLSDISGEKANSFSIITKDSISHSSANSMKTASLKATASPSNYVLSYQDLSFEVRYENKNVSSNGESIGEETETAFKYSFTIEQGDSKKIKNFVILATIENNIIYMTFSCDDLIDMDSASIKITLVYASHFDDDSVSYSDRSTVFDGNIKNAVKTTNVSFDRSEVMFNVNQFGIDGSGNVTVEDRATATVNYVVSPSANLTIEGFYLFYRSSDNAITQLRKDERGYCTINNILQVFVGSGCINLKVLKFEDGVNKIEIYLAPIDMANENDQITLTNEDRIPATLEVTFRNGTEDNPYVIQDEYDLQFVNNQLNAYYKLANDILISSSTDWTPIGQNAEKQFTGHIDGNNCTISGLVLNRKVDLNEASNLNYNKKVVDSAGNISQSKGYAAYYGLFGYVGMNAEIKNVTLTNFHVYVEYDGEQLGVKINEQDVIVEKGEDVYVDVYVGGFAGLNLGKLTNVTVIDDTERGYSSLKGNVLNSLRMSDDSNEITTKKGIGYQSKTLYLTHSNNVFAGGMVGLNAGTIDGGKAYASLFIRDKQEHPTLKGVSTAYVGGVSGVNISTQLQFGDNIYTSGSISNIDVYSLINATLVDPVFKGMIRNEDSVLGGIVGLNISGNDKYAFVQNSTCKTIIIGQNNVGGAIGQNYGVLDNVTIIPHIYGCDYVGGAVGINANNSKGTITKQNINILKTYFSFNNNKGLVSANNMTYKGLVYHTKVQFVDTLDQISLFNTSIVGRNYVGGLIGYSVDSYAENADLQKTDNLKNASQYDFSSTGDYKYATVAYSSVKSYFTREYTNVLDLTDEVKVLSQVYMDFSHKNEHDEEDFDRNIVANAESKYYGDIVVLSPTKSDVKNTYIGGLIGYSDGGVSTSGQNITAGTGGNYIHVYFDAIISNTYNVNSETDTAVIGGLIGKANGILFVYNANILGSVKNAKCVGGFVGDASGVFDRLGHEGKTPYTQNDSFFKKSIDVTQTYTGKFNINNSYTTLKSDSDHVQNFAYLGERIVYKTASGSDETSQVNTIHYSIYSNQGYSGQGNDKNHYYFVRRASKVTIKEYSDNEVKDKSSTRKVEYRKVLKYLDTLTVAVRDGYEVSNTTPTFEQDKEGVEGYFNVLKYDTDTYYWTKANGWRSVPVSRYNSLYYASNEAIYKPQSQLPNYVTFDELSNNTQTAAKKLLASSDNTSDYLYDNNGVAKYKKAEDYYIEVSKQINNYYQSQTDENTIPVIVYTVEQAYVEVKPKYKTINIAKYNNGSDDLYWYNSYTYTKSDDNATINDVSYDIYNKSEYKTKTNLAKDSSITEYVVGDNIYSNIEIANSIITFYKDGSVVKTVAYESKNMYHSMLNYVVNSQELNDIINELGQGMVEFSYNRLTASNSFYVGFKTYLYDQNGSVLKENDINKEVEFTETDAKNTTLTTNETNYSYYPTDWHYTNINYSDLIFKNYSNPNSNLSGYYVKYEDDVTDLEISEYEEDQVLIKGEGFVNPCNYIADYQLNNYAYALYEGGENGLVEDKSTDGKYTYHYKDVNGGLPLAFGKYQSETELNLIIDIAPENLKVEDKIDQYKVDNVIKNQDGSLSVDSNSRPIAVILDYKDGDNNSYSLIGGNNNVVDISLLPKFVGYDNLKVVSSNSAVVEVQEEQDTDDKLVYNLITKGVGYAVINISSLLNNTLSCDIVVLVKESVDSFTYSYSTPSGINTLTSGNEISVLKNNSSTFSVSAKSTDEDVVLKNFGVEYTITEGSAIINGETYTKDMTAYVYGVSQAFKVDEKYSISARPFYLYEVCVDDTTYSYRKYVDALSGSSTITTESVTYTVSPNSFAYNISAPGNIKAGIASQTSFEILVQSNDETLVPFEVCFGDTAQTYYVVETELKNNVYSSVFINPNDNTKDETIKVNNLNITLVKTTYDNIKGRHTIRFVVDVDVNDYNNFTKETKFEFACKIDGSYIADNQDKSDKFTFTLIPFQVENVRMSHYTKFWYDESLVESDKYETEYKSYKYASNKIIPGYNSLLQVDITPSYGQFDYVIAEIVGTNGSIIRQLVESQKSQSNAQGVMAYYDFPYFEQVDNASNIIKVTNKYSSFNDKQIEYNPSLALSADGQKYFNWDESGTLLFALNLDSKYENSTVTVRVRGYAQGDSLQFEQSITLNVVELPRIDVSWDKSDKEYITGDDKSATLNIGGSLALNVDTNADKIEWESEIGRVINENGKYKFYLDTNLDEISNYINSDYDIKCTVVKTIDGQQYSAYTSTKIRPVLYMISGVSFVDNEECVQSMKVYYNEEKDIKVQIDAIYNENNSLEKLKSDTIASIKASLNITSDTLLDYIETQLKEFAKDVWSRVTQQGANTVSKYLYLKTSTTTSEGLKEVNNSRRGYIITRSDDCFTIRIASSSVKDNIMASVAFDYTDNGLQIYPQEEIDRLSLYSGRVVKELTFNVHASSREDNPLPIKSVDDFKNMVAGEHYILLNDLVLSKWVPIKALFASLDGNGYTITITSFGDIEGLTDIGLFSTIGTEDSDLNYYTTIQNLYIDICPVVESENDILYIDNEATLEINIGATENVRVGVLAGTNYGIVTNVNVTNNASHIRTSRKESLKSVGDAYKELIVEDFSKYFADKKTYPESLTGSTVINIDSDTMIDTFSIVTNNTKETQGLYVGGLVGLNTTIGYITNSSVEGVNVKGMDYVAGFVAQNMGYISSSYFKGGSVISNDKQTKANSATAGFVAKNESGKIQFSYVLGAETQDVYDKNTTENNINSMSTYIVVDKTYGDMLVLNSNSEEYSASDKRTGKIKISLTDYASYAMYTDYKKNGTNQDIANLRALGSAVYTNNYASGFVGENNAYISNCYANILVSGTYGAGFAYQNSGEIESSYSMSSIKNNNENYYPFTQSKTDVDKCYYLYVNASDGVTDETIKDSFSKSNDDVATSLYAAAFGDYNTFTSWGFNSDYTQNNKLDDGVWFIPAKSETIKSTSDGMKKYLRESSYTSLRPELVSANIFTMSLRYYVTNGDKYEYNSVYNWKVKNDNRSLIISQGSLNNPLLIATASDFNTNLSPAKDQNNNDILNSSIVRMVHDIAFNEIQTATTFTTDYIGNFEGNGLSIDKLRVVADASSVGNQVTYLGLFRSIQSKTETKNTDGKYTEVVSSGTIRNLNINIEEMAGSNINFVGVLAGVIDGGKVYNINIYSTYDNVRVEGLNAVGGLAGMIVGDADIVNITNNISVKANAINQLNIFDPKKPNSTNTQFKMYVSNEAMKNPFENWEYDGDKTEVVIADTIKNISYVGGIAGIIDVNKNPNNSKLDYTDRIRQCYVNQSIILSGDVVGGLAGYVGKDSCLSNSEFVICENTTLNALRVGGAIVGHNEGSLNRVLVKYNNQKQVDANFYNAENNTQNNSAYYNALDNARSDSAYTLDIRSDVFGENAHYIGGIIGANFGGTLKNSYSRLNVVNINSAYAGGLIGLNIGGELDTVYTTGSVTGYFATGGIIGIQPAILSITKEKDGTPVTYYYLDDQSSAIKQDAYTYRYIENISNVLYSLCKSMGESTKIQKIQTTYSNVVGANIWRYSDTSVYRSQYYSTQGSAWIGVFVGYMSDVSDASIFDEGYEYLSPIKSANGQSRLITEDTFFKQTYEYNTASNSYIKEIGNIKNQVVNVDKTGLNVVVSDGKPTIISAYYTLDEIEYPVSRMQYYGSLRSLNEIVSRSYSMNDEISVWRRMSIQCEASYFKSDVKHVSIYYGFDPFNWNGTQIDSEYNTIVNEVSGVRDVFPEIVNNLKPKIINVTSETELRTMNLYLGSTFILQNDIELGFGWTPVGTKEKPFTGKLYSATGHTYTISKLSIDDNNNDYFGFIRVSEGAELRDFNIECNSIKNNTDTKSTSIAGGILVGLASEESGSATTTIKNVKVRISSANDYVVNINNTQYVGGVVGYGEALSLSGVTLEGSSSKANFFTSMYKAGSNISYGFGGLVGKFDEVDTQTSTTTNTLSVETTSSATVSTLSVKNIDFYVNCYVNDSNEITESTLIASNNRNFDESKVYVGGVLGQTNTVPDWKISTSGVSIIANMPDSTIYDLYIGGAVGYSSYVDYTSDIEVDTNIKATLKNNSANNPASVGGVFGGIGDSEVTSIVNNSKNTITLNITNANNKVYVGGVVGYASSTTFSSAESNTKSTITTTGESNIRAGGFVGFAENSTIQNVNIGSAEELTNNTLTSKIDLITLKDSNGGTKAIALGGIAGSVSYTQISASNVLGNINHSFDENKNIFDENKNTADENKDTADENKNTAVYSSGNTYEVYIGGAIGYEMDGRTLDQVSADVDIIDNRFEKADGTFNYGGLVGNANTYTIQNSYAVGKIYSVQHIKHLGNTTSDESNGTYLGGLVGNGNSVKFENCYSATQFVLPNSKDGLIDYSQSFWENTNKGGIVGYAGVTCTSTNVFYVKDFVPFSNGLCGAGVSAENLKKEFTQSEDIWEISTTDFYPLLSSASGKVTNTKGGGQNPIVVTAGTGYTTKTDSGTTTNNITSAQTVYATQSTGSDYDIVLDDRMSTLMIVGENKLTQNKTIKNNGSIYGGNIKDETIKNNGNIIGVLNSEHDGVFKYENNVIINTYTVDNSDTVDNSEGFIYASGVFELKANTGLIINSIYDYSGNEYTGNNLNISGACYTGSTESDTKSGLYSQNVEFFDLSDTSLDLDIDKYWTRVDGVNGGILVPKWMYKDHYYDDDYSSTYGWYASANVSGVTQNGTTYIVSSAEGLAYIAKLVNTGEFEGTTIELSADIDLKEKVWTPIGTKDHPFTSRFNGKGHTISNMSVVGNTYNGLFGYTNNATIQNLLVKDAQVASSGKYDYTAILVGYAKGTLTIEKVAIEDSHICAGNSRVAGMVGYLDACTLTVNNAYVIIAVNTSRTEFSFVVNAKNTSTENTSTITINNVYGVNYAYSAYANKYDVTETSSTETSSYYRIAGCFTDSDTKSNTYVCSTGSKGENDTDIVELKTLSALQKSESYKTLFEGSTVWTQTTGTNHELPHLDFSQKYWIDEGASKDEGTGKFVNEVKPSGTTYTITSASQLAWVAYQVNENNDFSGKTIQVTDDIDLAGKVWTPIGIMGHPFKGSFELASDKTISNMTCYGAYSTTRDNMTDTTTSYSDGYDATYGGLFGLVEDSPSMVINGSITNFVVGSVKYGAPFIAEYKTSSSKSSISVAGIGSSGDDSIKDTVSASDYAGGVVGKITGTEIVKVNVVGNVVKANISAKYAGGIVGYANYATIYNSSVSGVSITGTTRTGGIAGEATNSTLFNCKAESFTLTSTGSYSRAGGIVGYAENTNLSALKVTGMSADIKAIYAGGIVGYVSNSNIQNITFEGKYNNITSDYYGGVAGYMVKTNLSEISITGTIPKVTYGKVIVGYINGYSSNYSVSKYIVDNIYINISYNSSQNISESFILTTQDATCRQLFGGVSGSNIFSQSMFYLTQQGISKTVYYGDISSSSAWTYDKNNKHILKADDTTLYSNYHMTNADSLTAILDDVETVDEHVVITPYKLESVDVKTNEGMQYLAEWWTYRHKLSDNDTTINITKSIDYSADSIGNEKFPFVGTLNGNSKTITLSKDVSSQGIFGYATKLNANNITLKGEHTIGSSTTDYVGAIVGCIKGNSEMTFENIKSSIGVSGKDYVGGIIGAVNWSSSNGSITLTGCETHYATKLTVTGDTTKLTVTGDSYVGGIIGYVEDTSSSKQRVTITGKNEEYVPLYIETISSNSTTGYYVGGIVGSGQNVVIEKYKLKNSSDSDTSSYGTVVSGKGMYLGGVAGYLSNSTVNNITLNSIPVSSSTNSYVGGAVGDAIKSTISNVIVKTSENSNATISGNYYVGGIAGYIQQTKMYSNKVQYFNVKGNGSVGGLIGALRDASTDTTIELKDIVYSNTIQNAIIKQNSSISNESSNDYIGGLIGRLVAGVNSTFAMKTADNNSNKVSDTKIIYYKKVDSDEGWFGTYDNGKKSENNRWANTSGIVTIDNIKNMALGKYAQQIINDDYSYWWSSTYQGYSTKGFTFANVKSKTNTWFGPSATKAVRFEDTDGLNNYYLSTFGVSSQITGYGNTTSLSLPDLRSDDNIKNFFNSARGYNPSNSIAMVGTLYGSNNITDTVSKAENVTIESTLNGGEEKRVLYDRLTHWAYINMENGYHGALVIEWSYYIDSDQRIPCNYDFISDVQKYFTTKANKRIDVKYTYDITTSDNNFDLKLNNLTPVSESLRSLRDLFGRSTTAGGSTYKGLINEFVMAVYDKETKKNSLYCGNKWKSVDEYGNEKEGYTLDISSCKFDGGITYNGKFMFNNSSTTYYRSSSTNDPSVWYADSSFYGDRKIIKQKSSMNNA